MDEQDKEENAMEFNANITDAARQLVRKIDIQEGQIYEIPGYKGTCVAIADTNAPIQSVEFFTEGNRRYVVGPEAK